jgi:hypothetical protein
MSADLTYSQARGVNRWGLTSVLSVNGTPPAYHRAGTDGDAHAVHGPDGRFDGSGALRKSMVNLPSRAAPTGWYRARGGTAAVRIGGRMQHRDRRQTTRRFGAFPAGPRSDSILEEPLPASDLLGLRPAPRRAREDPRSGCAPQLPRTGPTLEDARPAPTLETPRLGRALEGPRRRAALDGGHLGPTLDEHRLRPTSGGRRSGPALGGHRPGFGVDEGRPVLEGVR